MDLAAMVVAYLAKIGVTLELDPMDYPSRSDEDDKKDPLRKDYFFSNDFGDPIRRNPKELHYRSNLESAYDERSLYGQDLD